MAKSTSTAVDQTTSKPSRLSGCLISALVALFIIMGMYQFFWGGMLAYIFSSARMLSALNLGLVLILFCQCLIYFFLARRVKRQHWLLSVALVVMAWLVLPVATRSMLNISTARVRHDGYSMGTSLPDQSYILADRQAYRQKDPQRGDIIIFSLRLSPEQWLIKRVIGLPGETISIQDGIVTVNDIPLEEPYLTSAPLYNGTWEIPEGQYFVLGDNRNDSIDSHQWGFLPYENIIAKAVWIYFPLGQFGKLGE